MSRRSMKSVHHEPDDPDIAVAMRARRGEPGPSTREMARRAEVSEQSRRNHEQGAHPGAGGQAARGVAGPGAGVGAAECPLRARMAGRSRAARPPRQR